MRLAELRTMQSALEADIAVLQGSLGEQRVAQEALAQRSKDLLAALQAQCADYTQRRDALLRELRELGHRSLGEPARDAAPSTMTDVGAAVHEQPAAERHLSDATLDADPHGIVTALQASRSELSALQAKIADTQERCADALRRKQDLEQQLAVVVRTEEEARERCRAAQERMVSLEAQMQADHERWSSDLGNVRAQVASERAEHQTVLRLVADARADLATVQREKEAADMGVRRLQQELRDLSAQRDALATALHADLALAETQRAAAHREVQRTQAAAQRLTDALAAQQQQETVARDMLASMLSEAERQRQAYDDLQRQVRALEEERASLQAELDGMHSAHARLASELELLETRMRETTALAVSRPVVQPDAETSYVRAELDTAPERDQQEPDSARSRTTSSAGGDREPLHDPPCADASATLENAAGLAAGGWAPGDGTPAPGATDGADACVNPAAAALPSVRRRTDPRTAYTATPWADVASPGALATARAPRWRMQRTPAPGGADGDAAHASHAYGEQIDADHGTDDGSVGAGSLRLARDVGDAHRAVSLGEQHVAHRVHCAVGNVSLSPQSNAAGGDLSHDDASAEGESGDRWICTLAERLRHRVQSLEAAIQKHRCLADGAADSPSTTPARPDAHGSHDGAAETGASGCQAASSTQPTT